MADGASPIERESAWRPPKAASLASFLPACVALWRDSGLWVVLRCSIAYGLSRSAPGSADDGSSLVMRRDPRVDSYIAKSAEFARPILTEVRGVVHETCPAVEETIKWGVPFYMYEGILLSTPAFKKHCAIVMWKGRLLGKDAAYVTGPLRHLASASDLPPRKKLAGYVRALMALNEAGEKSPARSGPKFTKPLVVPAELKRALARNAKARKAFDGFPPSHKREYADWVAQAKREDTRERRVRAAIEMIAQGKSRNWKYERA